MQSAWKWSPWVGSLQSDSANSYFTRMINSSKMITSCPNMINMSPPLDIDLPTAGTWTLGLVERDLKALSTMVFATWAIVDFSSGEDPCILVLVMAFQESKLTKKDGDQPERPRWEQISCLCPAGWTRPPCSGSRPLVIGVIAEGNRQSTSHLLVWSSQMKNHLLLYLFGPHEGLLRTHRVALRLNPWLKVVVVIVMSFELT